MKGFKIFSFIGIIFLLSACVFQKERQESVILLNELLKKQCQQTLGFTINSNAYSDCYNRYRVWLSSYGISSDLSYKEVDSTQQIIDALNQTCYTHWGSRSISSLRLWECIQQKMTPQLIFYKRQQNLEQQGQDLMRSVQQGFYQMNENVLLQEYMEKEKQRIAKETGKNVNKIDCHISKTFSGFSKVNCH